MYSFFFLFVVEKFAVKLYSSTEFALNRCCVIESDRWTQSRDCLLDMVTYHHWNDVLVHHAIWGFGVEVHVKTIIHALLLCEERVDDAAERDGMSGAGPQPGRGAAAVWIVQRVYLRAVCQQRIRELHEHNLAFWIYPCTESVFGGDYGAGSLQAGRYYSRMQNRRETLHPKK